MNTKRPWLLIEDDGVDEQAFRRAVAQAGLTAPVVCATSTETALARLRETPRPLLIVLDLNLPGRGGLDALSELRVHQIPIVVLTTSCDERDIASAYAAGACGYFAKALDRTTYQDTVATMVRYWSISEDAP